MMERSRVAPFLTFNGNAEEAMRFYASCLPGAEITKLVRYGQVDPQAAAGAENGVMFGAVSFMGQELLFLDMDPAHPAPACSWAMSLYIDCRDEEEFDAVFRALSQDGLVMMGPEAVAHIRKCAWVTDKFGVTWQPVWE